VLDLVVNDFLRDFFPRESGLERLGNLAIRTRDRGTHARAVAVWNARRLANLVYVYSGTHALYVHSGLKKIRMRYLPPRG
jgi:hypothetical protein